MHTHLGRLGVLAVFLSACGPVGGGGTTSSSSSSSGAATGVGYAFSSVAVTVDDPSRGGGLGLAVSPSGTVSIAYFVDHTTTQVCMTNFSTMNVVDSGLRLAQGSGENFTSSDVITTLSADGVAAAYDPQGNLVLVFAGGEHGGTSCISGDLVRATYSGATPTFTTLATDSGTGATCHVMQDSCNTGDVVGRAPSLAYTAAGQEAIAFQDVHYGFSAQTDEGGSDMETLVGGMAVTVDDSSGAGNFNHMFLADGRPAVVHVVKYDHTFELGGFHSKGVWLALQAADGTWTSHLVTNVVPTNQVSGAWHATQGFAVAYNEPTGKDLIVANSLDGVTWTKDEVDVLGDVGRSPSAAFNRDELLVAYGVCNGPESTGSTCDAADDGVRLATRADGEWTFNTVYNNDETLEGTDVRLVVGPGNTPYVAFKAQGQRTVMVATGTHK